METIKAPGVSSTIWRASIKTLIKLLSYPDVVHSLITAGPPSVPPLDLDLLITTFLEAQIDSADHSEEEQRLLLKQKMLVKIVTAFPGVSSPSQLAVFKYILSVVKKKTVDDLDSYYSH